MATEDVMSRFRLAFAGIGLAIASATTALVVFGEAPAGHASSPTAASQQAVPVETAEVEIKSIRLWEDFSGRLEAVDRVDIRPRVSGSIASVHFREGALVKAGDLLFSIDPAPYEAKVSQAEGQVAIAEAKVRFAQIEVDRGDKLSNNKTISQSDLDQRQSALSEALAGLRSAQASLRINQLDLDYAEVRAPVAGRVGKIAVTVGNLVAAGSSGAPLTTLVSVDPIYASFDASEELVEMALEELPQGSGALPPIEKIPVEAGTLADEGTPLKGSLQLIDNEVNASSGTIGVRALFPNPRGTLIPGQFVRIRMGETSPQTRVLISDRAIGTDQDKKYVYVVDGDNKVSYRPVVLGGLSDGLRIVKSGLMTGETIVVNGLQRIRPGSIVIPAPEKPKLAAGQ